MNREDEWREIAKKMLKPEHLPYGSPDITNPDEIMAIKAGYKCYADYKRDVEAVVKMQELRDKGEY